MFSPSLMPITRWKVYPIYYYKLIQKQNPLKKLSMPGSGFSSSSQDFSTLVSAKARSARLITSTGIALPERLGGGGAIPGSLAGDGLTLRSPTIQASLFY